MTSPSTSEFVTRNEFALAMARIDARFDHLEQRMDARFETHFARIETRFAHIETRFAQIETRVVEGDGRLEALVERRYVDTIRWTVGTAFGLYALMFGLILFVIARELAHP